MQENKTLKVELARFFAKPWAPSTASVRRQLPDRVCQHPGLHHCPPSIVVQACSAPSRSLLMFHLNLLSAQHPTSIHFTQIISYSLPTCLLFLSRSCCISRHILLWDLDCVMICGANVSRFECCTECVLASE